MAQQLSVEIKIDGIPFGMNRFSVVSFKDYISLAPEFLSEKQTFESTTDMQFSIENPKWVRISGPGIAKDIIAVPGTTYNFSVLPDGESYYLERINKNISNQDPNIYCDSVNVLLNNYLYKYNTMLFSGTMAKQTIAYCDSVENLFIGFPDALFQTYLGYRLDELRLLSKAWTDNNMYKARFKDKVFQPENPDYAYAFSEFYKGRLAQVLLKSKMSYGKGLINNFKGADTLVKWISQEPYYGNSEVGEGALLLGLTELLVNKNYSKDAILSLFYQMSDSSYSESVRTLASRFYKKYRTPVSGDQAPDLQLIDKSGNMVQVAKGTNKRTYLCFFDPTSQVVPSELAAINELKKILKDKMVIVPVIINAEQSALSRMQISQKLTFDLYRNTNISSLLDFKLKSDCTCMILAPNGTYVEPNAPIPTDPAASVVLPKFAISGR